MGLLDLLFGKKPTSSGTPAPKNIIPAKEEVIAINNDNGGFDAFSALYQLSLREIGLFMDQPCSHPIQDILRKHIQTPLDFEVAFYNTELKFITYIFSYPITYKLRSNSRLALAGGSSIDNDDRVAIEVTYELKQVNIQNSQIVLSGHADIGLMPENAETINPIDEFNQEYKLPISTKRFFVDKSRIRNTPINEIDPNTPIYVEDKKSNTSTGVKDMTGLEFEQYCKKLLLSNGFSKAEVTQGSHDYGGDIIAIKDQIKYVIQCKKYSSPVGIDAVQQVIGSKTMYDCHVAVVLTNSSFTDSARTLASKNNVILWDNVYLSKLQGNLEEDFEDKDEPAYDEDEYSDTTMGSTEDILPNGDTISLITTGKIKNIIINASQKRLANIAVAMVLSAADRYEHSGVCAQVTYNGETRNVTNLGIMNGNELLQCSWVGTVDVPLNNSEIEYANAIYHYTVKLLGEKALPSDEDIENNVYCKYNYTLDWGCSIGQELHRNDELTFQMFINAKSINEAIVGYLFYHSVFLKQIVPLNYNYSFAIPYGEVTLFIYKDKESGEVVLGMDREGHPTNNVPVWMPMFDDYKPSSEDNLLLKTFGCCFIEFINKINLLSVIEDNEY